MDNLSLCEYFFLYQIRTEQNRLSWLLGEVQLFVPGLSYTIQELAYIKTKHEHMLVWEEIKTIQCTGIKALTMLILSINSA